MNNIHPTAVIGSSVLLGEGNTVGAFVVLGGNVVIGDGNWIGSGAKLGGPPEVRAASHDADWLSRSDSQGVVIGDGNVIREDTQIHSGWKSVTVLGDGLFIMNGVYIAHDCDLQSGVTLASGVALAGHVRVGRQANLGMGVTVHQGRTVGALAMVGMSSVVTHDVPPYVKSFGSPSRERGLNRVGAERAGMAAKEIDELESLWREGSLLEAADSAGQIGDDFAWFLKGKP